MNGRAYVARTTIWNRRGEVVAAVGETCERVDPGSLPWLLQFGHVQLDPDPRAAVPPLEATPGAEGSGD